MKKTSKTEANTRLKVTLKSLKKCFECNHFRSHTPALCKPPVPDTQFLFALYLSPHHTLCTHITEALVEFHEWVSRRNNFSDVEKNYRTTTDAIRLDIFLPVHMYFYIWLPEKKRITKNCCVFFLFPHSTYSFHSTFNICSFYSEEFCGEVFFRSLQVSSIFYEQFRDRLLKNSHSWKAWKTAQGLPFFCVLVDVRLVQSSSVKKKNSFWWSQKKSN